ncbi:hypothetical protein [Reyranella sp.]|uniref:hypothetical protein n=1 Tax=Reyranella sp. TaxID=1929291 RepID=UPI003F6EFE2F
MVKEAIAAAAKNSQVRKYKWPDRGVAPIGYLIGMSLTYGRVFCKLKQQEPFAVAMARASRGNPDTDALALYSDRFTALGMDNSADGVDTLRHLFVLLVGLGMRESSGRYCEGRDRAANNITADTAEAGLFQTSWNARKAHALLPSLYNAYSNKPNGFSEFFAEGVKCRDKDWEYFGVGPGREFQELSKTCPAFAVEFAALGIRHRLGHWGPLKHMHCEVRKECDSLFLAVQKIVDETDNACVELVE